MNFFHNNSNSVTIMVLDLIGGNNLTASKCLLRMMLVILCMVSIGTPFCQAQKRAQPTTWWPDPSTGLMWAGQATADNHRYGLRYGMNWKEANAYCESLELGGYTGWRLPTLGELNAITYFVREFPDKPFPPENTLALKGGIYTNEISSLWTSTMSGDQQASVITTGLLPSAQPTKQHLTNANLALCTRPMEADLLQMAKEAKVVIPVPDVLTLQANIPLTKAQRAYQTGQFQSSITEAENSLLVKPDFAPAYWGAGISHGMLGQWDLAITNLETALKLDKTYADAKDALKWAKEGQKAAKKGKSPKMQNPQWNWTAEPPECFEREVKGDDFCVGSN